MHSYIIAKILYKMRLSSFKSCNIHKNSKVDSQCVFAYVSMGKYSYVGSETHITSANIGNFVSIGSRCQIGGGMHPLDMVSTSPVFLNGKNILRKNFSKHIFDGKAEVKIGNDVWIGDGCYIKAGITIGNGAVVGAHSVVTHNVEPYTIVAGVPARVIKTRFSSDIIGSLQAIKWWEWADDEINKYALYFDSPNRFIDAVNKSNLLNQYKDSFI
ncbi:MAG: CatB-related O-acetyltransferase [Clostridiales bacterium]|nr:CatB-related O-acetyltransferase [Clostridiales bacterium]